MPAQRPMGSASGRTVMAIYMPSPDRKKAASLSAGWVTVKGGGGTVSITKDAR